MIWLVFSFDWHINDWWKIDQISYVTKQLHVFLLNAPNSSLNRYKDDFMVSDLRVEFSSSQKSVQLKLCSHRPLLRVCLKYRTTVLLEWCFPSWHLSFTGQADTQMNKSLIQSNKCIRICSTIWCSNREVWSARACLATIEITHSGTESCYKWYTWQYRRRQSVYLRAPCVRSCYEIWMLIWPS